MSEPRSQGLSAEIAAALEREIDSGLLLPGQSLDERELATRFGVSRTPVRAALQKLAAAGLVNVLPRQGIEVRRISLGELRAMFELLAELEGSCAKLAARRLDIALRDRLVAACERCAAAAERGDTDGYRQGNVDFHEVLYEAARNHLLADQVRLLRQRTQLYRRSVLALPGRLVSSSNYHRRILEAVLQEDAETAQRLMIEHISVGGAGFADFVSMLPESVHLEGMARTPARAASPVGPRVAAADAPDAPDALPAAKPARRSPSKAHGRAR